MTKPLDLDALQEKYSLDAHYAHTPAHREAALQVLELVRLARQAQTQDGGLPQSEPEEELDREALSKRLGLQPR